MTDEEVVKKVLEEVGRLRACDFSLPGDALWMAHQLLEQSLAFLEVSLDCEEDRLFLKNLQEARAESALTLAAMIVWWLMNEGD